MTRTTARCLLRRSRRHGPIARAITIAVVAVIAMLRPLAAGAEHAPSSSIESGSQRPVDVGTNGPLDGAWTVIGPPRAPNGPLLTFDTLRQRLVLYSWGQSGGVPLWVKPLSPDSNWVPLHLPIMPTTAGLMVYDPVRDRVLLYGAGSAANEIWALQLSGSPRWTSVLTSGPAPIGRVEAAGIYDPVRDRLIICGGRIGNACGPCPSYGDTWALDLVTRTWTRLPDGPPARGSASAIYDPVRDRMVIFGGFDNTTGQRLEDTWALSLSNPHWSQLAATGPESSRHGAVYDEISDRMLVVGGALSGDVNVWAFSFASDTWTMQSASGTAPTPRTSWAAVRAGAGAVFVGGLVVGSVGGWSDESWSLNFVPSFSWSAFFPAPGMREGAIAVADRARDRLIVCGGRRGNQRLSDTWSVSMSDPRAWTRLPATGLPARAYHSAACDSAGDRLLVFGGETDVPANQVYSLDLANPTGWSVLTVAGSMRPSPRSSATVAFDTRRRRMILFGGVSSSGTYENDVWILDLSGSPQWIAVSPAGTPPAARAGAAMIYDAWNDRVLLFGGKTPLQYQNDLWALDLGSPAWAPIPAGNPPPARAWHTAIYDEGRIGLVVFGGELGSTEYDGSAWRWVVNGFAPWSRLLPSGDGPFPVRGHAAAYDRDRGRMLTFGGTVYGYGPGGELSSLEWGTPLVDVVAPAASRLALDAPFPNPCRGRTTITFGLPRPGRCVVEVFDASGRRVGKLLDARLGAGDHHLEWTMWEHRVGAGLYFVRLSALNQRMARRILVLDPD